ncbi:hypothetical protein GCM10009802_19500 [Streptomyces synnematoformans]|uniref:Uncharacterized protein n=1 Tax=Streptomyces synnematoformans TaxID=415721 RepID=A0ABN2XW05_9ACTN
MVGIVGVGETVLAVRWVDGVVEYFADGQLLGSRGGFAAVGGSSELAEAL